MTLYSFGATLADMSKLSPAAPNNPAPDIEPGDVHQDLRLAYWTVWRLAYGRRSMFLSKHGGEPLDVPTADIAEDAHLEAVTVVREMIEMGVGRESGGSCPLRGVPCPDHGFVHGAEAEELRKGIEQVLLDHRDDTYVCNTFGSLRGLLERVDARDSLAFCETRRKKP